MKSLKLIMAAVISLLSFCPAHAQLSGPAMEQKITGAKPGDIRVLATAAILGPLEAVRDQAQKAVGKKLIIEYGSARGNLKAMLEGGQACEVTLLLPDVDRDLLAQKKLGSRQHVIAKVPVGLGLRGDQPAQLDVSTKEGIRLALVNAAAVRYAPTGAARGTVDKIFDALNVASLVKDVSKQGTGPNVYDNKLAPGTYEIDIYPLSEIMVNKALINLGPVIPDLQVPAIIEASVCKSPGDKRGAEALIRFLRSPVLEPALKASGMER